MQHQFITSKYDKSTGILDLSSLGLESADIQCIFTGISPSEQISTLNLSNNFLCSDGVKRLVLNLAVSRVKLAHLDISENPVGPGCAENLGRYIQNNFELQSFHAAGCKLGSKGVKLLAPFLRHHPSLHTVTLTANYLDDGSVIDLLLALQSCPNIRVVQIFAFNPLVTDLARQVANMMAFNVTD